MRILALYLFLTIKIISDCFALSKKNIHRKNQTNSTDHLPKSKKWSFTFIVDLRFSLQNPINIWTRNKIIDIIVDSWLLLKRIIFLAGVLQGDMLAPYLFIICLDYVLRKSIDKIRENSFELTKKRSRRYPAKTITDADYADDIAILANTPNQAETLLHSLERAATGIGLYVNAHKTKYMYYKQTGDISLLN